jgi:hypothetical protein
MSNLTRSFVRGFGSALGFMAAKATVTAITRPRVSQVQMVQTTSEEIPSEVKLNWIQKILTFMIWVSVIYLYSSYVNSHQFTDNAKLFFILLNIMWILGGWAIIVAIFASYNKSKYLPIINEKLNQQREQIIGEIEPLVQKISQSPFPGWAAPMNQNDNFEGPWDEVKYKFPISQLNVIKETFKRRISFMDKYLNEFGVEKFKEVVNLDEPQIGMTEKEFLLWKTNQDSLLESFQNNLKMESYPTNVEESISGTTENRTLIYGTKKSGSYYKFKNGQLVSYTQRD